MREVLFRGKNKQGEWAHGQYCELRDGKNTIPCIYYKGEILKETLGQYTGLTDRNGKRIFEGDIVNCDGDFCVVRFGKHDIDCCGCCYDSHSSVGFYLERDGDSKRAIIAMYNAWDDLYIIGNIHDNPELLNR